MIRYLGHTTACDVAFVVFLVSWFVTRHVLFILAIKATWDALYITPSIWDPSRGQYMTKEIYMTFIAMLVALQVRAAFAYASDETHLRDARLFN